MEASIMGINYFTMVEQCINLFKKGRKGYKKVIFIITIKRNPNVLTFTRG